MLLLHTALHFIHTVVLYLNLDVEKYLSRILTRIYGNVSCFLFFVFLLWQTWPCSKVLTLTVCDLADCTAQNVSAVSPF